MEGGVYDNNGKNQGRKRRCSYQNNYYNVKRLNFPDNVIIDNIIKNCSLTEEEAKEALLNYEKE